MLSGDFPVGAMCAAVCKAAIKTTWNCKMGPMKASGEIVPVAQCVQIGGMGRGNLIKSEQFYLCFTRIELGASK